jgi:hypothetical protein
MKTMLRIFIQGADFQENYFIFAPRLNRAVFLIGAS